VPGGHAEHLDHPLVEDAHARGDGAEPHLRVARGATLAGTHHTEGGAGAPAVRGTPTWSGAPRCLAPPSPTITPPLGMARTTTSRPAYSSSALASRSPASTRSSNIPPSHHADAPQPPRSPCGPGPPRPCVGGPSSPSRVVAWAFGWIDTSGGTRSPSTASSSWPWPHPDYLAAATPEDAGVAAHSGRSIRWGFARAREVSRGPGLHPDPD